jgi:hypothetical protein
VNETHKSEQRTIDEGGEMDHTVSSCRGKWATKQRGPGSMHP